MRFGTWRDLYEPITRQYAAGLVGGFGLGLMIGHHYLADAPLYLVTWLGAGLIVGGNVIRGRIRPNPTPHS